LFNEIEGYVLKSNETEYDNDGSYLGKSTVHRAFYENQENNRGLIVYVGIIDDINNSGAEYVDSPYVTDKNIISSPHYKHLGEWMNETFRVINEKNDTKN